ncbi:MAG TPA: 1-deoxy-D-xylulose-5-phosphate reductoisomerase [Candidatus Limnocylindria bacterium]|nr:1-deoxy-D-xylulose-5-phosphate reductoisomerase [Candidatus Limnocylindria bacterium]
MADQANRRTRVALLGSTGSIGRQALDVLAAQADRFEVVALAAGRNADELAAQVARHRPRAHALTERTGADSLVELATRDDVDIVLVATAGMVALRPVVAALEAGRVVATANKETLVAGGHLVMPLARRLAGGGSPLDWLRPIDSEHSAIWQCLAGERRSDVARLVLTASGGPFRGWSVAQLADARPQDALAHPTWNMGAKITVDSATMMNKALEVIEARWLYDVGDEQIDVVVHPQSIVHSLVEFADGSLKAQLGLPDMRIPIQYALTYPRHLPSPAPRLSIGDLGALEFEPADEVNFPALAIGREAGRRGPWATAALIAADEVAVARFLDGTLDFPGIWRLCEQAVDRFGGAEDGEPGMSQLLELDAAVREWGAGA